MNYAFEASQVHPYRTETGLDHKAWAKQILWRKEQGDTELLMVQIKFATEAMNRAVEK